MKLSAVFVCLGCVKLSAAMEWLYAAEGESCTDACVDAGNLCDVEALCTLNTQALFESKAADFGVTCSGSYEVQGGFDRSTPCIVDDDDCYYPPPAPDCMSECDAVESTAGARRLCACAPPTPVPTVQPTPAPTVQPTVHRSGAMSGDPIVQVNGFRVKFDLPLGKSTLMWKDHTIALFAKADVVSADKRSQWFSEFSVLIAGKKRAVIHPWALLPGSKAVADGVDAVSTLSVTTFDSAGLATKADTVGYNVIMDDGRVKMSVQPLNRTVGSLRSEAVIVKSELLDFSVVAEVAKKFRSYENTLKYLHLDITMQAMRPGVEAGLFAELYGFIPMSADTAGAIKRVTRE